MTDKISYTTQQGQDIIKQIAELEYSLFVVNTQAAGVQQTKKL